MSCIYHRKELGGPIANRKILLTRRLHIPCDISKSFAPPSLSHCHVHSLIYSWIAKIVRSPGPPRVAIRGHRRLQPASKSGSFLFRSCGLYRPFFSDSRKRNEERGVSKERETRWCMCLDIRCTLDRGESIDARYNINAVIIRRHI